MNNRQINTAKKRMLDAATRDLVRQMKNINADVNNVIAEAYRTYQLPKATPEETINYLRQKVVKIKGGTISRLQKIQKDVAKKVQYPLLRKDKFLEDITKIYYQNGYYWNAYQVVQDARKKHYNIDFPKVTDRQIEKAVNQNTLSIFNDPKSETNELLRRRKDLIGKLNRQVELGLAAGDDYKDIAVRVDKLFGFRDTQGKLLQGAVNRRGSTYESMRILRTEANRSYQLGAQLQFEEAKDAGVNVRLQLVATLDDRTRPQSANMDGAISNENGEFQYPDGNWYIPHNTGNPEWDINDRETTIEIIEGYSADVRRTRDEDFVPYKNFNTWAKEKGIDKNRYGQKYWL